MYTVRDKTINFIAMRSPRELKIGTVTIEGGGWKRASTSPQKSTTIIQTVHEENTVCRISMRKRTATTTLVDLMRIRVCYRKRTDCFENRSVVRVSADVPV